MEKKIINEIDSRIKRIENSLDKPIEDSENQYEQLNQALSKVIANALKGELNSIKEYIVSIK